MKEFSLQEIRQKYDEYKEILEGGDRETMGNYTIEQLETMRQIVNHLEDLGFHLIVRKSN